MNALSECRLLIDPPACGPWNMAVDELLLEWAADEGRCCWRFYQWDRPTLSLGYFQQHGDRLGHSASRNCPAVRRLTGGGAIVHDAELTYSLVVPGGHRLAGRRDLLYRTVHTSLVETLAEFGIAAVLCRPPAGSETAVGQPFLCFQRRAPGDVLVAETKIAGSAQRRRRGAVLQHGSVLLGRSAAAPELIALEDLAAEAITPEKLAAAWTQKLSRCLAVAWREEPLSRPQRRRAAALAEGRYAAAGWTEQKRYSIGSSAASRQTAAPSSGGEYQNGRGG